MPVVKLRLNRCRRGVAISNLTALIIFVLMPQMSVLFLDAMELIVLMS